MSTVTTAIVGFIFVCIIFPHLIKNRTQYYIALALVLGAMVMHSVATMVGHGGFWRFVQAFSILLEALAVALLVMAAGGLSASQFAGEMGHAFEVVRRGEEEKEVIIPLSGQKPRPRREADDEAPRGREEIGDAAAPAVPRKPTDTGPISMD